MTMFDYSYDLQLYEFYEKHKPDKYIELNSEPFCTNNTKLHIWNLVYFGYSTFEDCFYNCYQCECCGVKVETKVFSNQFLVEYFYDKSDDSQ